MISNFFQKPVGVLTVLTAAVGGPYAAFETDLGTSLRRSLVNVSPANEGRMANGNSMDVLPTQSDPYSLSMVSSNPSSQSQWPANYGLSQRNTNQQQADQQYSNQKVSNQTVATSPTANGSRANWNATGWTTNSVNAAGQPVSTVYGPATVQPFGPSPVGTTFSGAQVASVQSVPQEIQPNYFGNSMAMLPPTLENRVGPSTLVPGRTDQLWDYTLGTPQLPQLQQQPNASVGGGTVSDLREVLRFDIVPGWLPQRFARVTTITSNVQMDGLRVPLITGTLPKDIAGSLTYYFDASQSLKRINLHGLTGDPTQLANLMVQFYQLKPEQSLGGQLFTARWNNRVTSVMQIAPAPIIYAGADHSKYIIFLELNQPSNQYGLSDEASETLRTSQATQRW